MFTGLIQSLGAIAPNSNSSFSISVPIPSGQIILTDLAIGDSVAVDGVCLTVESIVTNGFTATASPETLQRTMLGFKSETGSYVNLETSLRMGSKLGGHFVTGHVDGIGCLLESVATGDSWEMTFGAPTDLAQQWQDAIAPYLVPKGSIAVNGISLTVADCDADGNWFKAAVIPHSYSETNLCYLQMRDRVNIETDILGKYVNRLLRHQQQRPQPSEDISLDFLAEHGYV